MQWTGLNELREKYLSFFESKGHLRLDSFPLVPEERPQPAADQQRHGPHEKVVPGSGRAAPSPRDHLPEVHPYPGYRARGHHCPPRHLL